MHKTIFPKLKHKNDNYGNIARVDNLRKTGVNKTYANKNPTGMI